MQDMVRVVCALEPQRQYHAGIVRGWVPVHFLLQSCIDTSKSSGLGDMSP